MAMNIDSVRKVFDRIPVRDVVCWTTVIAGNAQNGIYEEALALYREMARALDLTLGPQRKELIKRKNGDFCYCTEPRFFGFNFFLRING
ncbi:hypothetical protein HN51_021388 [Arachis hypogaea]